MVNLFQKILHYGFKTKHDGPISDPFHRLEFGDTSIERFYDELSKTSKGFALRRLANVEYQQKKFPIYSVSWTSGSRNSCKLLILSGIHGNEVASVEVIPKLLVDIKNDPSFYDQVSIDIITPLNPVGLASRSRYNGEGRDINRDFLVFKTQEARLVRDYTSMTQVCN